jgi:hypothetical protein
MGEDTKRPAELRAIQRELEQVSNWELERGLASSTAFDHDQRSIADRILRARYAGSDANITLWILAIAFGAGVMACLSRIKMRTSLS